MTEYIEREKEIPLISIAVTKILQKFEAEGYGVKFDHKTLYEWLGIKMTESGRRDEIKKEQLDYMTGICGIKDELLDNYNLCIHKVHSYGYEILHPSDQIEKGANSHMRRAQKSLVKHAKILINTDVSELSIEEKNIQLEKINRIAFLKNAFRKRRFFKPDDEKLIGHKV